MSLRTISEPGFWIVLGGVVLVVMFFDFREGWEMRSVGLWCVVTGCVIGRHVLGRER